MKKELPSSVIAIKGATIEGKWSDTGIPVFCVHTPHEFNQLIGYVKFINGSNGTVLYRGQNQKYDNLKPSGARDKKKAVSSKLIETALKDADILNYFKLDDPEINGWKKYQEIIIEAALQHYGGKTYCMDFVDNHWCALWFGLYKFNADGTYSKRSDKTGFLYIFLYLADTNGANIRGLYIGDEVYTVDLRKAMPSYFLRPASQHGWVVRKKERKDDCDYKDNVLCVIKIKVEDADNWLGSGALLSQENFFPDYSIDEGYGILLSRQERSGVYKPKYNLIFPPKTIQNYHHSNEFFVSDKSKKLKPVTPANYLDEDGKEHPIDSINTLYALLLEKGWSQESSENEAKWAPRNPCTYQSAATALLVQDLFGGEILRYNRKDKSHYFNYIDGVYVDLTSQEYREHPFTQYEKCTDGGIGKKKIKNTQDKKSILIKNVGLHIVE